MRTPLLAELNEADDGEDFK